VETGPEVIIKIIMETKNVSKCGNYAEREVLL
jgi:hypothetical protein